MPLADWQRGLLAAVLDGDDGVGTKIAASGGRSAARGLEILRGGVQAIQQRALAESFPVLARLIGTQSFATLVPRYMARHPARSRTVWQLGAEMPAFLEQLDAFADWPYLADVARLEWAWQQVFHAADDPTCDWSGLDRLPGPLQAEVQLQLPQASALLESRYPVITIWQANQPGEPDTVINLDALAGERALILRGPDGWPRIERLDALDHALLCAIRTGTRLSELTAIGDTAGRLPQAIARGWLAGYAPPIGAGQSV